MKIYSVSVKTPFEVLVELHVLRIFRVVSLFNYQGSVVVERLYSVFCHAVCFAADKKLL